MTGMLAVSKAGHDKGKLYIIIEETAEYVYLVDGVIKTVSSPKKKKKKHIQIIKQQTGIEAPAANDEAIKRALRLYKTAQ